MPAMRVVIAPDSFGGTLSAVQVAQAIADGWRDSAPGDVLTLLPLSDGGPGFVDTLASASDGRLVECRVSGPLGGHVTARLLLAGTTAYVEAAQACGLHLVAEADRDPLGATTYGVGQLLLAAVESGARRVVVGLGGSATTDAGGGMLTAVGLDLLDGQGAALPYGGGSLIALDRIQGAAQLRGVELVVASDVDNPLVGPHGAAAVFGPQKGADDSTVARLDAGLRRWAEVVQRDLPGVPAGIALLPGGGAAGGLGAALLALGGRRESGLGLVSRVVGLGAALDEADLVLTGEGSFDWQSLRGKVPGGVAAAAAERALPCLVLAGQVSVGRREQSAAGVETSYSVAEHARSLSAALADPAGTLRALTRDIATEWSR